MGFITLKSMNKDIRGGNGKHKIEVSPFYFKRFGK